MLENPSAPLFQHQEEIIRVAQGKKYFAIFADMGTGKTRCAIELIKQHLAIVVDNPIPGKMYFVPTFKVLIIAPNTILENWQDEIHKWSTLKAVILQGSRKKRQRLFHLNTDIYIINYEALRIFLPDLLAMKFNMVIADESQKLKGHRTLQSKAAFKLAQTIQYKIIMTGTPIQNNPLDIFGQYRFLNPFIFGFSFYRFRSRYAVMGGYMNYEIRQFINLDELQAKIRSCSIRITKEECLTLPEKIYQTHQVDMTAEQKRVYKELHTEFISEIKGKVVTAPYILTRLIRLSQVTAGFIKSEDQEEINFETNPKLIALKEIIEALPTKDEKVVIFCRFIKEIRNLEKMFDTMFTHTTYVTISGETKRRQELINIFNTESSIRFFIGQIQTASLGINLQSARYCIFLSNSYSYGERLQCEDRLHRIGQSRNVTYLDIICRNSIDLTILNCLKEKKDLATQILEEVNEPPAP